MWHTIGAGGAMKVPQTGTLPPYSRSPQWRGCLGQAAWKWPLILEPRWITSERAVGSASLMVDHPTLVKMTQCKRFLWCTSCLPQHPCHIVVNCSTWWHQRTITENTYSLHCKVPTWRTFQVCFGNFSSLQVLSDPIAFPVAWHFEWEVQFHPLDSHILLDLRGWSIQYYPLAVKFVSKLDYYYFGYFHPISLFFDNENKYFSGWPKRYFG